MLCIKYRIVYSISYLQFRKILHLHVYWFDEGGTIMQDCLCREFLSEVGDISQC